MRARYTIVKVIGGLHHNAGQGCQPDRPAKTDQFRHQVASHQNLFKKRFSERIV